MKLRRVSPVVYESRGEIVARTLRVGWRTRRELAHMVGCALPTVDHYLFDVALAEPVFKRRRATHRRQFEYRTYPEAIHVEKIA